MRGFGARWMVLVAALPLGLWGCGDDASGVDAGADAEVDSGNPDGGADGGGTDGGGTDGGGMDGWIDGGGTDGGGIDGGGMDGGTAFAGVWPVEHAAAAGLTYSMLIDDPGALWTFGQSGSGQLGNGQMGLPSPHHGHAFVPTRPSVIDGFTMTLVSAGWSHAIALQSTGDVWTWGANDWGQLGDGAASTPSATPQHIALGRPAVDVGAGANHSLAVDDAGAVWAWGRNGSGQLGDGTTTDAHTPVATDLSALPAGIHVAAVGGGTDHSIALATGGTVWTWGSGAAQLGLGGRSTTRTPMQVVGEGGTGQLTRIVAIASGNGHCLALRDDGVLWAWGSNGAGQLGTGTRTSSNTPVRVDTTGFTGTITGLRAGHDQSFALLSDGSLFGWGENDNSQLGVPGGDAVSAVAIVITGGVGDVAGGRDHGVALSATGDFWAWGQNAGGFLGMGRAIPENLTPAQTYGPAGLTATTLWPAKEAYSIIQMSDGSVWGFGRGWDQSGNINGGASPVLVEPLIGMDVAQFAGGRGHSLILDGAGAVWAIGANLSGELGDGTTTSSATPVATDLSMLPAGVTITKVGTGTGFSVALASDGSVWAWGLNRNGQLGNGTTTRSTVPVHVQDSVGTGFLGGIVDIAVGDEFVVARDGTGIAWTWGQGAGGALGATPLNTCTSAGTACNRLPQQVCAVGSDPATCTATGMALGAVSAIAAGFNHTLLLRAGQVLGFGEKNTGQVGDGTWNTTTSVRVPIVVVNETNTGPLTGIAWIAAGNQSSFAGAASGTIYAWGHNDRGQLAKDPTTTRCGTSLYCRTRPTAIPELAGLTIVDLQPGAQHSLALDSTGTIWSWGDNAFGELGQLSHVVAPRGAYMGYVPAPVILLPR